MNRTINVERLERLADLMVEIEADAQKREGFDLRTWYCDDVGTECGFSACAVGWATLDPWFIEQGFQMDKPLGTPVYQGKKNWVAVESFFGLSETDAEDLFATVAYLWRGIDEPTPADVAEHVREFLADKVAS